MAIDLKKGNSINLAKQSGEKLNNVCVGINWGSIKGKSLFGLLTTSTDVDLDGSVATFDINKQLIDKVYYSRLVSSDGAIKHSGDDLEGDQKGDDGRDNEVVTIDFTKVSNKVSSIVLFLNSYKGQDFSNIPYSKIRIYEGTVNQVNSVFANFNLSANKDFAGFVSMIMGKFYRLGDGWSFQAIGEPVESKKVHNTIDLIQERYL